MEACGYSSGEDQSAMGCLFSRRPTSTFDGVRLVHINGYVEDYPGPITVSEVTGKPPKLACFSSARLLSFAPRPLPPHESLEPNRLYFLLPYTVFQSDWPPVDLVALVTRLTALAQSGDGVPADAASKSKRACDRVNSRVDQHVDTGLAEESEAGGRNACSGGGVGSRKPWMVQSWRPMLDTIVEMSLGLSMHSLSSWSAAAS